MWNENWVLCAAVLTAHSSGILQIARLVAVFMERKEYIYFEWTASESTIQYLGLPSTAGIDNAFASSQFHSYQNQVEIEDFLWYQIVPELCRWRRQSCFHQTCVHCVAHIQINGYAQLNRLKSIIKWNFHHCRGGLPYKLPHIFSNSRLCHAIHCILIRFRFIFLSRTWNVLYGRMGERLLFAYYYFWLEKHMILRTSLHLLQWI